MSPCAILRPTILEPKDRAASSPEEDMHDTR